MRFSSGPIVFTDHGKDCAEDPLPAWGSGEIGLSVAPTSLDLTIPSTVPNSHEDDLDNFRSESEILER